MIVCWFLTVLGYVDGYCRERVTLDISETKTDFINFTCSGKQRKKDEGSKCDRYLSSTPNVSLSVLTWLGVSTTKRRYVGVHVLNQSQTKEHLFRPTTLLICISCLSWSCDPCLLRKRVTVKSGGFVGRGLVCLSKIFGDSPSYRRDSSLHQEETTAN